MGPQLAIAIQGQLVVGECGACFVEIVLGLIDLFGTRSVLEFIEILRFWKRIALGMGIVSALLLAGLVYALLRLNGFA